MTGKERIVALDILRGLALFWMIVVHFHQKMELPSKGTEDLIGWFVWIFVETKAWAAFAFLFGASFAIFLKRAEARGLNVVPMFLRRMFALAVFGVLVQYLLGFSILLDYAIWGVLLLFIRRWPTRVLLVVALAAALWTGAYSLIHLPISSLVLIILGFLAIRHGLIENPRAHLRAIIIVMTSGLASWAVWWLFLWNKESDLGFGIIRDQWLGLTYTGAVLLLLEYRPVWKERLSAFGVTGRMALTNYVLQAALFWVLGHRLGLKIRPYYELLASVVLFLILVVFSRFWLARHRYGPLEQIWRAFTMWEWREYAATGTTGTT